jgi:hypothetical protein
LSPAKKKISSKNSSPPSKKKQKKKQNPRATLKSCPLVVTGEKKINQTLLTDAITSAPICHTQEKIVKEREGKKSEKKTRR